MTTDQQRPYRCMTCHRRFTAAGARLAHTADPHGVRAVMCGGNVVIDGHDDSAAAIESERGRP